MKGKKSLWLGVSLVALTLVAACGPGNDDDDGAIGDTDVSSDVGDGDTANDGGGDVDPDAGTDPVDDVGADTDADPTDVGSDATDGDTTADTTADADVEEDVPPEPGTVTVTVFRSDRSPANMLPVVSHDPDGSIRATAETDASGEAELEVVEGGSVTTVGSSGGTPQLLTVLEVSPGDSVLLIARDLLAERIADMADSVVNVRPPGSFVSVADGPASSYEIQAGCGSERPTELAAEEPVRYFSGCLDGIEALDVVAYALNADGEPMAYTQLLNDRVPTLGPHVVDLPSWESLPNHERTFEFLNAPDGVLNWSMYRKDRRFGLLGSDGIADLADPMAIQTVTRRYDGDFPDYLRMSLTLTELAGDNGVRFRVERREEPVAGTLQLQLGWGDDGIDPSVPQRSVVRCDHSELGSAGGRNGRRAADVAPVERSRWLRRQRHLLVVHRYIAGRSDHLDPAGASDPDAVLRPAGGSQ